MAKGKILSVNLGMLSEEWEIYCKARGVSRSDAIRQVIRKLVARASTEHVPLQLKPVTVGHAKIRVEIRLLEEEHRIVFEEAARAGFSVNAWIVSLIRANLSNSPQFGQGELEQLASSNSRLLAIGRNLNQIARVLNAAPTEIARLQSEAVETLSSEIKSHTAVVGALVQSNVQRWSR